MLGPATFRRLAAVSGALALAAGALVTAPPGVQASNPTTNFASPGRYECTVSGTGLVALTVEIWGGYGGGYSYNSTSYGGGTPAGMLITVKVSDDSTLYVTVGANGANSTAQRGGAAGGDYSAISLGSHSGIPLVVAGGGGGAGSAATGANAYAFSHSSPTGAGNGGRLGLGATPGYDQNIAGLGGNSLDTSQGAGGASGSPGSSTSLLSGAGGGGGFGAVGGSGYAPAGGVTGWSNAPGAFGGGGGGYDDTIGTTLGSGGGGGGWAGGGGGYSGGGGGGGSSLVPAIGVTAGVEFTAVTALPASAGTPTPPSVKITGPCTVPPTISDQPDDTTVNAGSTASFSVTASAVGAGTLSYQWQSKAPDGSWPDVSGATSATYTTPSLSAVDSGTQYRVRVTDSGGGFVDSKAATVTVIAPPTISVQPTPQTVTEGATATFSVTATGGVSYQWQSRPGTSGSWSNVTGGSGGTTASYTTAAVSTSDSGTQFQVLVTNSAGTATSNPAILTVNATPTPTPNPGPFPVPTPTPTPTPSPSPTEPPAPEPVPPLPPGEAYLTVDGAPQPVIVEPNTQSDGVSISGSEFDMELQGLDGKGEPLNLAADGVLILNTERQVEASGTGFKPDFDIDLYMNPPTEQASSRSTRASEPVYVGTVKTDAAGDFSGLAQLPPDINVGDHVVQAVGYTKTGATRAVSLGVRVEPEFSAVLNPGTRIADGRYDRITTSGTTTGLKPGSRLTAWIRYSGQTTFTKANAKIVVQADGTFRWTRLVRPDRAVTAYVAKGPDRSNTVTWRRIR